MHLTDTILATSSPPVGAGMRAIVRLSGPEAWTLSRTIVELPQTLTPGHYPSLVMPLLHPTTQIAAALLFRAPHSFTGQDIVEIHLPNSPALLRACSDAILRRGGDEVRLAGPGEFSARAFFNQKIDLTQAEGIAAVINATTETQLRAAESLREGNLHKEIARAMEQVADLLALIEAGIDFADEEGVSFVGAGKVHATLQQLAERLEHLLITAVRVDRLDALPTVVLIGKPNVGKSSLINALTGQDRSIVSHIAGTTRDILSVTLHTNTGDIRLLDVPGDEIPSDELNTKMMDARRLAILDADLVIRVVDHTQAPRDALEGRNDIPAELIVIQNKRDLLPASNTEEGSWLPGSEMPWGRVSAKTGYNVPRLREVIARLTARQETLNSGRLVLNQRHRFILQDAKTSLRHATGYTGDEGSLQQHAELLAADLRHALDLLGQITGTISPDDVLGRIFANFCIGK